MATTALTSEIIPGPRPMPVLGWWGNFIQLSTNPMAYMTQLYQQYGPIAAVASDRKSPVFAFGPIYNHLLLSNPDRFHNAIHDMFPFPDGTAVKRIATGVATINGPQHQRQRKLLMPAFHRKQVERYCETMVAMTERTLDQWNVGEELDIAHAMKVLALDIVSATLFDLEHPQMAREIGLMHGRLTTMLNSPQVYMFRVDAPGTPFRRTLRYGEQIERRTMELMRLKRERGGQQHDVMALLMQARDENGFGLSDEEILGDISVLFIAGHETSAAAMTWTLFLLDQHRDVLANLLDEIDGVLKGSPPSIEQLGQLTLTEHVIKESMRILPPGVFSRRHSTEPFKLGPYDMSAGRQVLYSPYITHRLPELYDQPDRFVPERWQTINPSPYEYLPFGAGPRMCIGASFAMTEMKIVLAMLLQRFQPTLLPEAQINHRVLLTLQPRDGMPMRLAPRGQAPAPCSVQGNIRELVALP